MVKVISERSKELFPISTIINLVNLFENEFLFPTTDTLNHEKVESDPNLALLSIILGTIEHSLTFVPSPVVSNGGSSSVKKQQRSNKTSKQLLNYTNGNDFEAYAKDPVNRHDFPALEFDMVLGLYDKFKAILFSTVNQELYSRDKSSPTGTSRDLIKNISDIFWNSLSRNYLSDKPHLQSLYTFLTSFKLDSFGLALAVVAGCQVLSLSDVHLVLSEDHAWVVFGKGEMKGSTAEVTWHGKGSEDKRGRPIETDDNHSWLYLKGSHIFCNRWTEIAAIISSINPSVNSFVDSLEMGTIQQRLLWKLYDEKYLQQYPMAIGTLADLEDGSPTPGKKSCVELFEDSITSNKHYYKNMHVYPYVNYGAYCYRREDFKGALKCWAAAAQVVSHYRYSKLDEEVYKEFFEISQEQLTSMMKKCSTGFSANSPTRNPHCYADLLKFFDGICLWEELAKTPVLHSTWIKCWITSLGKFESTAREGVKLFNLAEGEGACDDDGLGICDTKPTTEISTSSIAGFMDMNGNSKSGVTSGPGEEEAPLVHVYFKSFKMKSMKTLLEKSKFNPPALSLQLSALNPVGESTNPNASHSIGGRSRGMKTKPQEDLTISSEESLPQGAHKLKRSRRN